MSTRCNIIVREDPGSEQGQVQLYRHHDGTPEVILRDVATAIRELTPQSRREIGQVASAIVINSESHGCFVSIDGKDEPIHPDVDYVHYLSPETDDLWRLTSYEYRQGEMHPCYQDEVMSV